MRRLSLYALFAAAFLAGGCLDDRIPEYTTPEKQPTDWKKAAAYVFDSSVIPEIHVTVPLEQWNHLLDAYDKDNRTVEYVHCDVTYRKGSDVTAISDAGIRLKGNTSRRRPEGTAGQMHRAGDADWHHCHFGLDLHRWHDDAAHSVHGINQVYLKWFKDDPCYCRELYCYDLFRRFGAWTAVNDVYARMFVKVEGDPKETYYGIYEMIEQMDKSYLRLRKEQFGTVEGNLWKCRWYSDLNSTDDYLFGIDDDTSSHPTYELQTNREQGKDAAFAQLKDFILKVRGKTGNSFKNWIEKVTDVDLLLRTYAVSVAVGMWDDYWNNGNNYFLYFDSADKYDYHFWFIPYDYDNTLGTSYNCGVQSDSGRQDPLRWGSDDNPLITKILSYPEWKAKYVGYLKELAAGDFSYPASSARIRAWQHSIAPYVDNDTCEDTEIQDRPASWGTHGEYRLLEDGANNFFRVKASVINAL